MDNGKSLVMDMAKVINNRRARERAANLAESEHEARRRYMAGRRRDARSRGYRGPLTRAEASRQALAALQTD